MLNFPIIYRKSKLRRSTNILQKWKLFTEKENEPLYQYFTGAVIFNSGKLHQGRHKKEKEKLDLLWKIMKWNKVTKKEVT